MTTFELASPARSGAKRAQAHGDSAEALVEQIHAGLPFQRAEPGAWFIRRYAQKKMTRDGFRHTASQGPDFGGGVVRGGVAIACEIEVKFCARSPLKRGGLSAPSLPFERFTDAELRYLGACARAGGLAVVLVLTGINVAYATWHAVPWREIEADVLAWQRATKEERTKLAASVTAEQLEAWHVKPEQYLRAGWLR